MSRISDALVSRDLITRVLSVQDGGASFCRITEQGEDLVRRLLPKLLSLRACVAKFSEAEQRGCDLAAQAPACELGRDAQQTLPEQPNEGLESAATLSALFCVACAGLPSKQKAVQYLSAAPLDGLDIAARTGRPRNGGSAIRIHSHELIESGLASSPIWPRRMHD